MLPTNPMPLESLTAPVADPAEASGMARTSEQLRASGTPRPSTRRASRVARTVRTAAISAVAVLALAGCASGTEAAPGTDTSVAAEQSAAIATVTDPWVKATDGDMTAVFGVVTNTTGDELVVVSASAEIAGVVELHETVDDGSGSMLMQEVDAGFTIPAHGTLTLEPGGDHIMLMQLTGEIVAGDVIAVTLEFADGSTVQFEAPAKDYSGANENYGGDHGEHDGEHGDDDGEHGDHGDGDQHDEHGEHDGDSGSAAI